MMQAAPDCRGGRYAVPNGLSLSLSLSVSSLSPPLLFDTPSPRVAKRNRYSIPLARAPFSFLPLSLSVSGM